MIYLTNIKIFFQQFITKSVEDCIFKNNKLVIYIETSGNISIIRSNFWRNSYDFGSAIHLSNSFLYITDSVFIENNSTNYGGAIYMKGFGNSSIIRTNFSKNFAPFGPAIYLSSSQSNVFLQIMDSLFFTNNCTNYGGAIYMEILSNTSIIRSSFSKNLALYGAAIYLYNSQPFFILSIIDCTFTENNSSSQGGAIYLEKFGNFSLIRSNFSKNSARYGGGMLLYNSQPNSIIKIIDCFFIENNATTSGSGGAIYMQAFANTSIVRTNFSKNFALFGFGIAFYSPQSNAIWEITDCVFILSQFTSGEGAIYMNNIGNSSIIGTNFSKNLAMVGPAIFLINFQLNSLLMIKNCSFSENNATSDGAIFMQNYGNILIIKSYFSKNFAPFGAGTFFNNPQPNSLLNLTDCIFIENNSTTSGGGVYLQNFGNTNIIRSIFLRNVALYGTGIFTSTSQTRSILQITDSVFVQNNSTSFGGAIYMKIFGIISILRNNFTKNLVDSGAAIFLTNSQTYSNVEIADCNFNENNSTTLGGAILIQYVGNISISRSNFSKNFANSAGSIYIFSSQYNTKLEIKDCIFIISRSTTVGGAIFMKGYGNSSIIRNIFTKNLANSGAAIYLLNSQSNSSLEINDCVFSENNSTLNGGAIFMQNFGNTSIIGNNFSNNVADLGAGIYSLNQSLY